MEMQRLVKTVEQTTDTDILSGLLPTPYGDGYQRSEEDSKENMNEHKAEVELQKSPRAVQKKRKV